MTFGERIRQLRTERDDKIGMRELATRAGMDFSLLSKIENGLRPAPELQYIFALADALDVPKELFEQVVEELLALATESEGEVNSRLTEEQLRRFRESAALRSFTRLKPNSPEKENTG